VPFSVHARPQADDTVALIDDLEAGTDYLIIDLEGSKDQIVTFALSRTDLCVIPMDGSPMEARQAAQAVRLVETTARMIRSPIAYTLLFARTNAAFLTTDERDVRQEMENSNINTLPVRIARRAPYTRIFRDSLLLAELPDLIAEEMKGKTASAVEKARSKLRLPSRTPATTPRQLLIPLRKRGPHERKVRVWRGHRASQDRQPKATSCSR
jgi:chromosome partitioning protein